jgi:hypothetical protein
MTLGQNVCSICRGWQKSLHSLTHGIDWPDILIDASGFLLVGPHLLWSKFHVYGWGFGNNE